MFLNGLFLWNSLYFRIFRDIIPGLSLDSISSTPYLFSEPNDLIPVGVFFSLLFRSCLSPAYFLMRKRSTPTSRYNIC